MRLKNKMRENDKNRRRKNDMEKREHMRKWKKIERERKQKIIK